MRKTFNTLRIITPPSIAFNYSTWWFYLSQNCDMVYCFLVHQSSMYTSDCSSHICNNFLLKRKKDHHSSFGSTLLQYMVKDETTVSVAIIPMMFSRASPPHDLMFRILYLHLNSSFKHLKSSPPMFTGQLVAASKNEWPFEHKVMMLENIDRQLLRILVFLVCFLLCSVFAESHVA